MRTRTKNQPLLLRATATLLLTMIMLAAAPQRAGAQDFYISTTNEWNIFCDLVNEGVSYNHFIGKTVRLGADITVSRMAGSSNHRFSGTFDGQGHRLTVNYENTGDNEMTAPFSYVAGATIRNLIVAGTISGTAYRAAGIIGETGSTGTVSHIINCVSSVDISSGRYTGGFSIGGNVEIEGCVFNGKINGTSMSGGFIGFSNSAMKIKNSLFAPQDGSNISGGTFYYNGGGDVTPVNSYYTAALGTVQGKASRTVTAGENVTISAVGIISTQTQYNVSGITAYSDGGLKRGTTLYYGSGDRLTLILTRATGVPAGYQGSYTVSAGTLSGTKNPYTLTMPEGDVTVNAVLSVIDWATANAGTSADPYMIYNKDQLDLLAYRVNNGTGEHVTDNDGLELYYKAKYFRLGADIAYPHTTQWDNPISNENNYEAIGIYDGTKFLPFSGDFDGAGHTVSGIRIFRSGRDDVDENQGIFGFTYKATIRNLRLADARITGYDNTGGIVGHNYGATVTDCHVANDVCIHAQADDAWYHGGIVGRNDGIIEYCTSSATLTLTATVTAKNYGAIAGRNGEGCILRNNLAIGATVPTATYNLHGAIVGTNEGSATIEHNYYTACTVANVKNATGVGCGYINYSSIADITGNTTADVTEMTILNVTFYDGAVPAMRDNADNSTAIALLTALAQTDDDRPVLPLDLGWGAGKYPMQLAGRTLYKDGAWNTLCLPFDVTLSGSVLDGPGVEVKTLTGSAFANGTLTLNFTQAEAVTTLEAGKPYLVRWTKPDDYVAYNGTNAAECSDLVNPMFTGVTVSAATANVETDYVDFIGILSPTVIYESGTEKTNLYLGSANKLYYPTVEGFKLNACRGYFKLKNGLTVGEVAGARSIVLDFGDETTGIENVNDNENENGVWTTVGGVRLDGKPTQKGLYIHGDRKVVIK